MLRRLVPLLLLLTAAAAGFGIGPALAAGNPDARVLLHVIPNSYDFYCHATREMPACGDVKTSASLYPTLYNAFLLVVGGSATEGISGVTCGIDYTGGQLDGSGLDIYGWGLCASIEYSHGSPAWPGPGSSNLVVWDTATACQRSEPGGAGTGVVARAGYFYCAAYTPATLRIGYSQHTGHLGKVVVGGCSGGEDVVDDSSQPGNPSPLGYVSFSAGGVVPGYNPCTAAVPVASTTWSRIKLGMGK